MNLGILGAGHIARKMALTLSTKPNGCECYAVASRQLDKAQAFAGEMNIPVAYGSYEELVADPRVDLIYVATPHSHHYEHARLAIEHGKPCLIEKAFTANARQAEELIRLAHQRGVFITEAIWTRYMPLSLKVNDILASGVIGRPVLLSASLCYPIAEKERIVRPELCGGALLDLGVYVLDFARMYLGTDIVEQKSLCTLSSLGVDIQETISLRFRDGAFANLEASVLCPSDKQGVIRCEQGYILIDNINCPTLVQVFQGDKVIASYTADLITGYEFEVFECQRCLREGLLESPLMPHAETLAVMRQMDALRQEWGVTYPMD